MRLMCYGQDDIMLHLIRNRFYTYCRQGQYALAEEMRNVAESQDMVELVFEFDEYLKDNRPKYQYSA